MDSQTNNRITELRGVGSPEATLEAARIEWELEAPQLDADQREQIVKGLHAERDAASDTAAAATTTEDRNVAEAAIARAEAALEVYG